ncbi:MAG: ABC transporter ATP-binding protein [Myxococcales bacterium]|nr:ABC transporter ATP-binding protein [Myxococcales bacterium]
MSEPIVRVEKIAKTYRLGFWRKRVEAIREISFEVHRGEVFGLLGPNGAGKTTTIKSVLGLIFPSQGEIRVFGERPGTPAAAAKVGYMPENPYLYQYLRPRELLDLCARLAGIEPSLRAGRIEAMLEKVGLSQAVDRSIGKLSKGMMQRLGLAQALMHEPELLILDEPMSGLDPIGRKEIRDLLLEEREKGTTLLFTSHILSDVESLCDRVVIVQGGRVIREGRLHELLEGGGGEIEITLTAVTSAARASLAAQADAIRDEGPAIVLTLGDEIAVQRLLTEAIELGATIRSVIPHRRSLERFFTAEETMAAAPSDEPLTGP